MVLPHRGWRAAACAGSPTRLVSITLIPGRKLNLLTAAYLSDVLRGLRKLPLARSHPKRRGRSSRLYRMRWWRPPRTAYCRDWRNGGDTRRYVPPPFDREKPRHAHGCFLFRPVSRSRSCPCCGSPDLSEQLIAFVQPSIVADIATRGNDRLLENPRSWKGGVAPAPAVVGAHDSFAVFLLHIRKHFVLDTSRSRQAKRSSPPMRRARCGLVAEASAGPIRLSATIFLVTARRPGNG